MLIRLIFDFFTAIGCYLCVNGEVWDSERDTILRHKNNKQGNAANRYCEQIKICIKEIKES